MHNSAKSYQNRKHFNSLNSGPGWFDWWKNWRSKSHWTVPLRDLYYLQSFDTDAAFGRIKKGTVSRYVLLKGPHLSIRKRIHKLFRLCEDIRSSKTAFPHSRRLRVRDFLKFFLHNLIITICDRLCLRNQFVLIDYYADMLSE